jgi:hypothetical protein
MMGGLLRFHRVSITLPCCILAVEDVMKKSFIDAVMKAFGIPKVEVEKIPLQDLLRGRDLEKDVEQLDLATLKALFRRSGMELRKRL